MTEWKTLEMAQGTAVSDQCRQGPLERRLAFFPNCVLIHRMKATFTYWKESDGKYLGYLNSHPEHWTQGEDLADLKEHLRDLYEMFSKEDIPGIKRVAEIEVA